MNLDLLTKILKAWEAIKAYFAELKGLSMKMKVTLLMLLSLFVIALTSSILIGCITPNESYVLTDYRFSQNALPDLIEYIKADTRLSDLDKETRSEAVQEWKKLIEQAYSELQ